MGAVSTGALSAGVRPTLVAVAGCHRYEPGERPPIACCGTQDGALLVEWGEPGNTVAAIEDHTNPSVLSLAEALVLELFELRPVVGCPCASGSSGWTSTSRGRPFRRPARGARRRAVRHDHAAQRRPGAAGVTDLHWRGGLGDVLAGRISATLGMSRGTAIKLARRMERGLERCPGRSDARAQGDAEPEHPNNPVDPYIRRLAEREATVTLGRRHGGAYSNPAQRRAAPPVRHDQQ